MHKIDSESGGDRREQGGDNDHGREAVQEHADYQHQQIYQDQEYILVVAQRDHTLGQHLGNPLPAEIIAQNIAGAQDHQHGTHALNGFLQDGRDVLPLQFLVDELAYEQGVRCNDSRALGRVEDANAQAQNQTEGDRQRPCGFSEQLPQGLSADALGALCLIAPLLADEVVQQEHGHRQHQAGNIASSQQLSDGNLAQHGEHDQAHSGRYDRGDHSRCRRQRAAVRSGIAVGFHLRQKHLAVIGRIRKSGAGDAAHHGRHDHVHVTQTAHQVSDQGAGKVVNPFADAGVVHDGACDDEERRCHHGGGLGIGDHSLNDDIGRHIGICDKIRDHAADHGVCHGHAQGKADRQNNQGQKCHNAYRLNTARYKM